MRRKGFRARGAGALFFPCPVRVSGRFSPGIGVEAVLEAVLEARVGRRRSTLEAALDVERSRCRAALLGVPNFVLLEHLFGYSPVIEQVFGYQAVIRETYANIRL